MHPGRELDVRVAQEIFGHEIFVNAEVLFEKSETEDRPLRNYSQEMESAWMVAEKMRVSLIPIETGQWFAFAGEKGWASPEAFSDYLRLGDFTKCGASVNVNAAQAICEAALVAHQKQKLLENSQSESHLKIVPDKEETPPSTIH
ncbi:MAG: hypothetical protein ACAH59_05945 [Pseudobdellovibrionaceae bacterium]